MASNSEKTNAKNLENLHIANSTIAGIAGYDPSNKLIEKVALKAFETAFDEKLAAINAPFIAEKAAVAAQTAAFSQVSPKVTKLMKAAKGQGLPPESIANLQTTVNRLRGTRVTDKTPDNPLTLDIDESKSNVSTSQRSLAGILEHLDLLADQFAAESKFKPNEPEFQPAAVSDWIAGLHTVHNAVLDARPITTAVRQERDAFCYNKTDGLIPRMNMMKAYAESILDKDDARLKILKKLKFVDITNK